LDANSLAGGSIAAAQTQTRRRVLGYDACATSSRAGSGGQTRSHRTQRARERDYAKMIDDGEVSENDY